MFDLIVQFFPNMLGKEAEFLQCISQTLQMMFFSGIFSVMLGVIVGVLLTVTNKGRILENRLVYNLFDKIINIFRSVPFIILIALLIDFTRMIVGTGFGVKGAIIPLIFGTVPFFSRQVESALIEIDEGIIEAALASGSTPWEIIYKIYLRENIPGLIRATMITMVSLIGLTAMMGAVGGGGLGDFAIRYGFQRRMTDVTILTVLTILIFVSIIQGIGNYMIRKTTH
ncbi:Methionine import system permease protein MetP [bioreactor metagenome]|uniref:Methionine import system permease protein MetP n=1 Tax=bioreactor metagenome TaxID=1076179 RepID=A0A644Y7G1_9ZZZZ|nr:methionine ABC transporter permease [Erysipelotrichaceae bacterium]